jgi:VWFA-related protein
VVARTLFRCLTGAAALFLYAAACSAQIQVVSSVIDKKTAQPVTGLTAQDFRATDDKAERQVQSVQYISEPIDGMLLLDASLMGEAVKPIATVFIDQLQPKEEMSLVEFASSADLIQDFTSSKELLKKAVDSIKYGNEPNALDALYASIDGGFANSTFRKVIFLLTTGYEGNSRVSDPRKIVRLAQKNAVTICPVYLVGAERSMMEDLAMRTGGASFRLNSKDRSVTKKEVADVTKTVRSHYLITLSGNKAPGEKFKLTVNRPEKLFVSYLPLE